MVFQHESKERFIQIYMFYYYNGTKVYYRQFGKPSSKATLLLHGWGRTGEDFETLISQFPERSFLVIDFPPFGQSEQDLQGWSIFTYAQMVISLCEHLRITSIDIVGHSFGGRIALLLCAVNRSYVHSCIITGGAGMKPKRKLSFYYKVAKYKLCKRFGKNLSNFGSSDYQLLSPEMRKTFVSIVQTHLDEYAKTITTPVLLVWGKDDKETPLYMAKRLNKYIKKSRLEVLDDCGHFAFLDRPLSFYGLVKQFWEER